MNTLAFLGELLSRDIRLSADGGQLKYSAPPGALTPQLREQLRNRKAEILEFLRKAEAIGRLPAAIVPLQPHGTRTPIFGVGGHNGDVYSFRDLARQLGEDQPFYGLWPPGLDGKSEPLARIEDLGVYLAEQVRVFRPSGPCIIAGYCGGGAGAYELARQMVHSGVEVPLLALFGCQHPTSYRFMPYWRKRVAHHARVGAGLSSFAEQRAYVGERIRGRLEQMRRERTPAGDDPQSRIKHKFEKDTLTAVRRYTPGPFSGRVCLFIANRRWLSEDGGTALRWREQAARVEEYYGPERVDPERMLVDPDAAVFARLLEECL